MPKLNERAVNFLSLIYLLVSDLLSTDKYKVNDLLENLFSSNKRFCQSFLGKDIAMFL